MNLETFNHLLSLSQTIPLDDESWGTEVQIEAENAFWLELEKHLSPGAWEKLSDYALKGTTEENVKYAITLMTQEG